MQCGTLASVSEKPQVNYDPLEIYLNNHGLLNGLSPAKHARMITIARLIATEPEIKQAEICRRLVLAKNTVKQYFRAIQAKKDFGHFDLSPYAGFREPSEAAEFIDEYDPAEAFNQTLKLITTRKKQLLEAARDGIAVSTNEIKNLNDVEAKINNLPQHHDFKPQEFYDQLSDRVPVETSMEVDMNINKAEFEEMGKSGDLSAEEYAEAEGLDVEDEKVEEPKESDYSGIWKRKKKDDKFKSGKQEVSDV